MSALTCIGLGYCARYYVAEFGHRFTRIVGTMRNDVAPFPPVEMVRFDGATATPKIASVIAASDALLISAAPGNAGDPVLTVLHAALAVAPRLRSIVYLSTVGVYGDHAGNWIDEETAPRPVSPRSQQRLDAERAWQAFGANRGIAVAVLHLAGIYGPGQNALVNVRSGTARRVNKPGQIFNRIHVADIAQAIEAAFAKEAAGIFNVADDAPTPPGEPLVFAAKLLRAPQPPEIPFDVAVKTMSPMAASFYGESKRVRNDKLKSALGVRLRYPTYREGLTALHAAGE